MKFKKERILKEKRKKEFVLKNFINTNSEDSKEFIYINCIANTNIYINLNLNSVGFKIKSTNIRNKYKINPEFLNRIYFIELEEFYNLNSKYIKFENSDYKNSINKIKEKLTEFIEF